jgi:hypothetical protein
MLGCPASRAGRWRMTKEAGAPSSWLKVNEMIWCSELSPALPHPAAARRGAAVGVR